MREILDAPIAHAAFAVELLRADFNRSLLPALAHARMTQSELKVRLVLASGSAMHRHLGALLGLGLIEKRPVSGSPRRVEYGLTGSGKALAEVVEGVEAWLRRHPERPEELTGLPGWRAFVAFNEAWRSSLLAQAAGSPWTKRRLLTRLTASDEQKLHRELLLLTGVGLLGTAQGRGGEELVALSGWCRLGFGLLGSALRWEREHFPDRATPIPAADAAVGLAAAVPLSRLPAGREGVCTLTVKGDEAPGVERRVEAVWVRVEAGRVRECAIGTPPERPDAWIDGDLEAWFAAILDGSPRLLRIGGEEVLARGLIDQLHFQLCVSEEPAPLGTGWYSEPGAEALD